ncbi:hypothetical protein EV643_102465 [Kribbella sp. VKM Ac-2527]|uniref:Uncharacterized protein n=1 Tax=Kribbella caucasensis TaxID=2512215 RepID=A0A4R6KNP1_9ACTN|nr:hypothetical protein [Kribbella sp. VKM Ac-2527]TDO52626.1 hypothetical protein EV643_102465 [Kribbella sp. VKM Ac-2527]
MTFITEAVADIGVYAAMWANRGEQPTAAERAAASQAVERIDATLRRLHRLRGDLVTEMRQADDETARRVDKLLRERGNGVVELPDEPQD